MQTSGEQRLHQLFCYSLHFASMCGSWVHYLLSKHTISSDGTLMLLLQIFIYWNKLSTLLYFFAATFAVLLEEVQGWFSPGMSTNGKSLVPKERILVFLMFCAGNNLGWISRYGHEMSAGAVHSCIHTCITIFSRMLVPRYVKLPTAEQSKKEALDFQRISTFPPIAWAAVDGSHIKVTPRIKDEEPFWNR